ncbi:hypothetical protein [Variovorax guangxiensis]|uniref:hypothetical protein n=1 Tax=Variovorax guangxiensis TaxID=1775474 RepID=UPI0028647D97|nr:hypothetical protein [Variovorax guangxiensis]MDR6856877.1 hypothetical protein [Variovorax guangxiensis]
MNASSIAATPGFDYELRFQSLRHAGRAYAFPCDATGRVDLDALSERARENYLYARVVVGNELAWPNVLPLCTH